MNGNLAIKVITESKIPLVGARITILELSRTITSDAQGMAQFGSLPAGPYTVRVEKGNYRPQRKAGEPVTRPTTGISLPPLVTYIAEIVMVDAVAMAKPKKKVIYLDIEHTHMIGCGRPEALKDVVSAAAQKAVPGAYGVRVWYGDFNGAADDELLALFISGNCSEWSWYNHPDEKDGKGNVVGSTPSLDIVKRFITTTSVPIIAACGGHQLIAKAFAGDQAVDHIHFKPGEDRDAEFDKTLPVSLTQAGQSDPIYNAVSPQFRFFHHDEVTVRDPRFDLLASTGVSANQSFKYNRLDRIIYTSQFHPEQDDGGYSSGAQYMQNFFKLAATFWDQQ